MVYSLTKNHLEYIFRIFRNMKTILFLMWMVLFLFIIGDVSCMFSVFYMPIYGLLQKIQ
jgi:hypothetical protein